MTDIDHEAAERIARDIGKTYQWPGDEAVRLVFAAYLERSESDAELRRALEEIAPDWLPETIDDARKCIIECVDHFAIALIRALRVSAKYPGPKTLAAIADAEEHAKQQRIEKRRNEDPKP